MASMAKVTTSYSLLKDIELKGFEPDAEPFKARDLWRSRPVLVLVSEYCYKSSYFGLGKAILQLELACGFLTHPCPLARRPG